MKKLNVLAILCLFLSSLLFSTEYPLGTFSFMGNKEWAYNNQDTFNSYMQQLGYNTSIIQLYPASNPIDGDVYNSDSELFQMFNSMRTHGLKAAVMDAAYSPGDYGSSYAYTTGSYMRFEAEFCNWTQVKLDPDDRYASHYWYGSRETRFRNEQLAVVDAVRVGGVFDPPGDNSSYDYVWQCNAGEDQAGFAFGDLKYRWKGRPTSSGGDSLDIRIGKEFVLKKIDPGRNIPGDFMDRLYIRYAFKLDYDPDSIDESDEVLSFSIVGYPYAGGGHAAVPDSLPLIIEGSIIGNEYNLTRSAYESLPTHPDYSSYRYLDVEVTYAELAAHNLFKDVKPETPELDTRAWCYDLVNINPRVYWHGNCNLSLDFIEIRDQQYKNIESNPGVYETAIASRISSLQSTSNNDISHVFTFDEPYPPQFRSYQKLETSPQLSGRPEKQFTAVNVRNFRQFPMGDPSIPNENKDYNNVEAFINVTNPKYLMVNPYPITPDIHWNDDTSNKDHIQNILDDFVLDKYGDAKEHADSPNGAEFYACVQAWGRWSDSNWLTYILPPPETQQMLQYLPLCYGADGIFNYRLFGNVDHPSPQVTYDEYGALVSVHEGPPIANPPTFNAIQKANGKIQKYGPIITNLEWKGSNTILQSSTNPYLDTSSLYITGIANANSTLSGPYGCYVQAGYFQDSDNNASIMLVNRRANYFNANGLGNPKDISISNYYACYPAFDPQKVAILISESASATYGDYVGLYDVECDSLYYCDGWTRDVKLEPGEGKLLQMCGTLPSIVTENISLPQKSVLGGEITLTQSSMVQNQPNSTLIITPDTHITLLSGTVLNLAGTITIGDSVRFSIEDNAYVNISEANCEIKGALFIEGNGDFNVADSTICTYDEYSQTHINNGAEVNLSGAQNYKESAKVIVTGQSELTYENARLNIGRVAAIRAEHSSLNFLNSSILAAPAIADSIVANNLSDIKIQNSIISSTSIYVRSSDLFMEHSQISVNNSAGIIVSNPYTNRSVRIIGNQGRSGFTGMNPNTKGIDIKISHSPIIIRNTDFNSLGTAITKATTTTAPDSIFDCYFEDCVNGIHETSSGSGGRIENCTFSNVSNIGVNLMGSIPTMNSCTFNACGTGIFFDGTYYSPNGTGVYNSSFSYCDTAIKSRSSNPRVQTCNFDMNEIGVLCDVDSNLDLSHNAYNYLANQNSNIKFYFNAMYNSYIQLYSGHNDFYHFGANTRDFEFDSNYSSSTGYAIDATKNWFESDLFTINDPAYIDYVQVEAYDPDPNTSGTDPDGGNRYLLALHQEATGQFDPAVILYKAILDEQIPAEKSYYNGCIDGIYRIKLLQEDQLASLSQYIGQKIVQYAVVDSFYTKLLKDYQVKTYVARKEFQSAIDLIQVRIDVPASPIDSLRAVLDLEIVLQLAAMDVAKKPVTTDYLQYKYASVNAFRVNHDKHLDQLYDLLNSEGIQEINIPLIPMISSNYPNPFNPTTTIEYSIPQSCRVGLNIYNIKGQKVRTLVNSETERGRHRIVWNGRDDGNQSVASGVYFIRLEADGKNSIRKVMLLK